MSEAVLAWWFEPKYGVLGYGDGRTPGVGVTHCADGEIELCHSGLHASIMALDALGYAGSSRLWRVSLSGSILYGPDKLVASQRQYLWTVDINHVAIAFSRWCALSVVGLWNAPQVVLDFLRTGDESKRAAASDAAWDAAWYAANAAWRAARDAASAAAVAAARDAARYAANAAWYAARAAASDAAREKQESMFSEMIDDAHNGKTEWIFGD